MITRSQSRLNSAQSQEIQHPINDRSPEPSFFRDKIFQRQLTLWLKMKMGRSVRGISELLDKPKSTVQDDIDRWHEFKTVEDIEGRGRKKKIKINTGTRVIEKIKENRRRSARDLWRELINEDKENLSYATVLRHINRNFICVPMQRLLLISPKNKKERTDWVTKYASWRSSKWQKVVWTDEKIFELHPQTGKLMIRIMPNEARTDHAMAKVQQGGGRVMFWGAISHQGTLMLLKVKGWVDSIKYQRMMEEDILPLLRKKLGRSFILQQDNAGPHTSNSTMNFFEQEKVELLEWPSQSPDLNPIENVWAWLQAQINKKSFQNIRELEHEIMELWENMDITLVRAFLSVLPKKWKFIQATNGEAWNKKMLQKWE